MNKYPPRYNCLFKLISIVFVLYSADYFLGSIFNYCMTHPKGGETKWEYYEIYKSKPDIAIFGSSRARHHYSTKVFSDSLGGKTINYGKDGMGIIYHYAKMKAVTERWHPNTIVLEIFTTFDLAVNDNSKYIAPLKYYYSSVPAVKSVIDSIATMEKYKLLCNSYKWNTEWYRICRDALVCRPLDYSYDGYWPLDGQKEEMDMMKNEAQVRHDNIAIDSVKVRYLKKFIQEASKGSKVYVFVSPWYRGVSAEAYNIVRNICQEYGVYYCNMFNDSFFANEKSYWFDGCHLNSVGAEEYSKKVAHLILKHSEHEKHLFYNPQY